MSVTPMPRKAPMTKRRLEIIILGPEKAMELLENNKINRPISQPHVNRIADQIRAKKWRFNGNSIKISEDGEIVDGQHRLWAVIEAKRPVETMIFYGVQRDAFATLDTLQKLRNGADMLSLNGVTDYRREAAAALAWLIRWQRDTLQGAKSRTENSEIEEAYANHPGILQAVERASKAVKGMASPSLFGFLFYIMANRDAEIAERMLDTLEDPAGVSINDPFFRLRQYLTSERFKRRRPVVTMALAIKCANAAKAGKQMDRPNWRNQGEKPEPFPKLTF